MSPVPTLAAPETHRCRLPVPFHHPRLRWRGGRELGGRGGPGRGTAGLIDFDLAKPATRAEEMFNAMMWWAPLFDPRDVDPLLRQVDVPRRARILADGRTI